MRIAVANPKGGAGKTTVAVNLAGAVAASGEEVLLVDLAPAGDATVHVGLKAAYETASPNLRDVLCEGADPATMIRETERFDVLPSNLDLVSAPNALSGLDALSRALDDLEYDRIVIDCPPRVDTLSDSALVACDSVLVPTPAGPETPRAIERLFDQFDSLESTVETTVDVAGFVATPVRNDGVARETVSWLASTFEGRAPVWTVPERVAVRRAWQASEPLVAHAPNAEPTAVFETIASEL